MSNLSSGEGWGIHVETIGNQAYDNVTSILFRSPYIHLDDYHDGDVAVDLILPTRGISYYACMDEPLEVVPKESGALFFDDELTHGGAYLEVDRIHKAYGIQETDDKDPNITGGEGALVFPNDGTADISVTFRVFNEQKDESLFTAKLVNVTNAGTVTDIKADAVSVKIAGGSVGSIVTLRAKGINIKAKDMIGIQFKSDKKDGCYLQSNSRLNPLVETIVNYKELTK